MAAVILMAVLYGARTARFDLVRDYARFRHGLSIGPGETLLTHGQYYKSCLQVRSLSNLARQKPSFAISACFVQDRPGW